MDHFSLKITWNLDELLFSTTKDKKLHQTEGEAETPKEPTPELATYSREGSHHTGISPRGARVWCPTSGTPTPGSCNREATPKTCGLENKAQDFGRHVNP